MNITKQKTTSIQTFKTDDGLEIIIDTNTGESFASKRGYSRLSGVPESTVRYRVNKLVTKDAQESRIKTGEVLTAGGIQGAQLLKEDLVIEWLSKDNPELASAFTRMGLRKYFHTVAGFNTANSITKQDLDSLEQRLRNEIRSATAPINTLQSTVKKSASDLLESIKKLKELQPRTNQILSVIPIGYLSYAEFKDKHNYVFKRGKWSLVEKELDANKVIKKSPLNSIKYYEQQEVINCINKLNVEGALTITYGKSGNATKATVS